jgi:hypothetical protein
MTAEEYEAVLEKRKAALIGTSVMPEWEATFRCAHIFEDDKERCNRLVERPKRFCERCAELRRIDSNRSATRAWRKNGIPES